MAALTLPQHLAAAEIVHVRDYQTHESADRWTPFEMKVTSSGDVLTLIPQNGKLRLTRIRNWLEQKPADQTIDLPGWPPRTIFSNPDRLPDRVFFGVEAELFVTADGRYAVCIAPGFSRDRGTDDLISVVDLLKFQVVGTIHTPALGFRIAPSGGLISKLWELFLHPSGYLALLETSPDIFPPGKPSSYKDYRVEPVLRPETLAVLTLPSLSNLGECHFSETHPFNGSTPWVVVDDPGECGAVLAAMPNGPASLSEFLQGLERANGFKRQGNYRQSGLCQPSTETADGRFKIAGCGKGHFVRGFWANSFVTDEAWERVGSVETDEEIGRLSLATRDSVTARYFGHDGRSFLLVVERGTRLKVYEITDSPPAKAQP